jgi:hypothetical protein
MQRVRELAAACPDADTALTCRTVEVSIMHSNPRPCVDTHLSEPRTGVFVYPAGKQRLGSRLSN